MLCVVVCLLLIVARCLMCVAVVGCVVRCASLCVVCCLLFEVVRC